MLIRQIRMVSRPAQCANFRPQEWTTQEKHLDTLMERSIQTKMK